jgi:hypothetical protein
VTVVSAREALLHSVGVELSETGADLADEGQDVDQSGRPLWLEPVDVVRAVSGWVPSAQIVTYGVSVGRVGVEDVVMGSGVWTGGPTAAEEVAAPDRTAAVDRGADMGAGEGGSGTGDASAANPIVDREAQVHSGCKAVSRRAKAASTPAAAGMGAGSQEGRGAPVVRMAVAVEALSTPNLRSGSIQGTYPSEGRRFGDSDR